MAVAAHFALESILRKRVYSFKHSGNSRGEHRGPEKVWPDRRSGLKMSELRCIEDFESNFLKEREGRFP